MKPLRTPQPPAPPTVYAAGRLAGEEVWRLTIADLPAETRDACVFDFVVGIADALRERLEAERGPISGGGA